MEHWKTRYEVAQAYIDIVHEQEEREIRAEKNRRKRERKKQKKKNPANPQTPQENRIERREHLLELKEMRDWLLSTVAQTVGIETRSLKRWKKRHEQVSEEPKKLVDTARSQMETAAMLHGPFWTVGAIGLARVGHPRKPRQMECKHHLESRSRSQTRALCRKPQVPFLLCHSEGLQDFVCYPDVAVSEHVPAEFAWDTQI